VVSDPAEAARAAQRLAHDLGRYVRFSAPSALEEDTEALRERLARDVLATRSGPHEVLPAAAVFDAWLAEEGHLFESERLQTLRLSIEALRALATRIPRLGRGELEELDRLTLTIAGECRRLASEGSSR
jgi:hypothetical protein